MVCCIFATLIAVCAIPARRWLSGPGTDESASFAPPASWSASADVSRTQPTATAIKGPPWWPRVVSVSVSAAVGYLAYVWFLVSTGFVAPNPPLPTWWGRAAIVIALATVVAWAVRPTTTRDSVARTGNTVTVLGAAWIFVTVIETHLLPTVWAAAPAGHHHHTSHQNWWAELGLHCVGILLIGAGIASLARAHRRSGPPSTPNAILMGANVD